MDMDDADDGRNEDDAALVAAVRLMRLALPLLDRARCDMAALHLQHAIDSAGGDGTSPEDAIRAFEADDPVFWTT